MRTFVIADASKRKAKPIGILLWDADPSNKRGRFSIELSTSCNEDDLPLSLSFLAKRNARKAMLEESEDWVRSRIVPEDRQNIVEVLIANGLAEYDEISLIAASKGRSSDDDFLVYEVDVPDEIAARHVPFADCTNNPIAHEGTDLTHKSRADQIIDAVERRRNENGIYYAYIDLPDTENTLGGTSTPLTEAPRQNSAFNIGRQIHNRRIDAGLTQKQLAAKAGITQSVLSRIESGRGNPTLSLLEEIAAALGTSIDIRLAP